MKLAQNYLFIATLITAAVTQTSCETLEPSHAETAQTNDNIYRHQSAMSRESDHLRQDADDQADLAQGMGVGSRISNRLEAGAASDRAEADNIDTASRMMGRGAAN